MATLYQRDGIFYVNYSINGRRIRKSIGRDEKEARIFFKELEYRLFKGDIKPNRPRIPID